MLSPWQQSANLSVLGKTEGEKVCTDESGDYYQERPGHAGRHVESGLSQLRLQTVLWDAGTARTSWEESQQVHVHPGNPSSACPLVYDRWRQEAMYRPSQRWTRGRRCLQRTDWATRPSSPPNPPHWEATSPNLQVLYAKPTSHHNITAKVCYRSSSGDHVNTWTCFWWSGSMKPTVKTEDIIQSVLTGKNDIFKLVWAFP